MHISRSVGYGMLAVGYISQNDKDGLVMASTVSKAYGIPLEYLLKIMQQLVRINILRSKRGPRGGFCLARPIKEISILEIIEAINGPLAGPLELALQAKNAPFSVNMEKVCTQASDKATDILRKTSLADMFK